MLLTERVRVCQANADARSLSPAQVTLLATGFLRSTPAAGVVAVLYYASSLALVAVALARVIRGLPTHNER